MNSFKPVKLEEIPFGEIQGMLLTIQTLQNEFEISVVNTNKSVKFPAKNIIDSK